MKENILIKHIFLFFLFTYSGINTFCQNPQTLFEEVSKEYPNDRMVQLDRQIHYQFKIKNNQLELTLIDNGKIIFLKNPSGMSPLQSLYSSQMRELTDFEANTYIPNGKKYKRIPVTTYKEKMNANNYAFYDDMKELSFTFPGIAKESITELNSVHRITEPRLLPSIFLNYNSPIRNLEITIECDPPIDFGLIYLKHADTLYHFTESRSKKSKIYTCTLTHLPKITHEDHEPDITYFVPHIIPRIKSYTIKGKKIEVLEDLDALYSWYYSLIKGLVTDPVSPSIQQIADSLTQNCTTQFEEVEALYYWVQSNIKYIDFEFGRGGFVPRKPENTCKNRYGDCKDKATLL